ncbi:MAG TPA: NTP transferase domain-containing protein [Acidobacteriota bacterium]|nr:NTP transferase domain-containing protein [Acidobacteriota bacterium]
MHEGKVRQAVILAAGNGSRMASAADLPKPLVEVGDQPLMGHILGWLEECGLERVFIVVGYRGLEIRRQFESYHGLPIEWVHNPLYDRPNGVSLLAVEDLVESSFLLLMSDHLFQPATLRALLEREVPEHGGILATDSKLSDVFDLQDATKVHCVDNCIQDLGKNLDDYNAVDTGMFSLSPTVFWAMRDSRNRGDASLSGGILSLARQSHVETWDIGSNLWIDIDTPQARDEAERMLAQGCFSAIPKSFPTAKPQRATPNL